MNDIKNIQEFIMKKILFSALLSTQIHGLITLNNPETLIEDSAKILEQEHLAHRALSSYGYIYNLATTTPQVINSRQAIPFSSNGALMGITHTENTPQITIAAAGTYFVSFVVYAVQANQFALFLQENTNTTPAPVCNTNYGVGTAFSSNSGFAIITTTVANEVLTLVNYTPFVNQANAQGTNVGIQNITGQTTLAYNNNTQGGISCGAPINSNSSNAFSSFNGGLQINTINAAVLILKLD